MIWLGRCSARSIPRLHGGKKAGHAGTYSNADNLVNGAPTVGCIVMNVIAVCSKIEAGCWIQESFDEVVTENMETFDMSVSLDISMSAAYTHIQPGQALRHGPCRIILDRGRLLPFCGSTFIAVACCSEKKQ